MSNVLLSSAIYYHSEGLCVIPVVPRDKRPAIEWEIYHTVKSTLQEIKSWFSEKDYNIGIVHGEVSGNFVSIDIDHDAGMFDELFDNFPILFRGRVEQSGSLAGYHIPLRLKQLPDFGSDNNGKPRGNSTWKTPYGNINVRVRHCQTVVPPSVHPSGNRYRFIQKGDIQQLDNLCDVINWLGQFKPKPKEVVNRPHVSVPQGDTLLDMVLAAYPNVLTVFEAFGITGQIKEERNGELRLLGHGGLLITDDKNQWYCFEDEIGGSVVEAWGWCKYGAQYDKHRHFRTVLNEMAKAAGIELDKPSPHINGFDRGYWARQYQGFWERVR